MGVRIAVASDEGETISYGHFAHAGEFIIIDYEDNGYVVREARKNPFSYIPDPDDPRHFTGLEEVEGELEELAMLHGVEKYSRLKKIALDDVDVIVSSGGCPTSIMYFTSENVKMIFTEPGTRYTEILETLKNTDLRSLPPIAVIEDGKILTE